MSNELNDAILRESAVNTMLHCYRDAKVPDGVLTDERRHAIVISLKEERVDLWKRISALCDGDLKESDPTTTQKDGISEEEMALQIVEINRLRASLESIAGGSFPNASTLAIAQDWKAMYGALQKLADDALNKQALR